jgi:putative AlgH/UPF0301 family transcriptional regulator
MSLRKRLPFAMLFTIVALAASGGLNVCKAQSDAPKPNTFPNVLSTAPATSPRSRSNLLQASFVPIQFKNPNDLGPGKLLVASRSLGDPNFAETVVLLVHYDEKGVLGLILNRRTDVPLSRVLDLKAAKDRSDPVYLGGPVELSTVFGLFQSPSKVEKAENIFGGVYLISDKDLFEKTISARPDPGAFHVYLGYAGWTLDQLQAEVKLGAWFVFPADTATVFTSDPDSLWLKMIEKTELHWARVEPFAQVSQPARRFQ